MKITRQGAQNGATFTFQLSANNSDIERHAEIPRPSSRSGKNGAKIRKKNRHFLLLLHLRGRKIDRYLLLYWVERVEGHTWSPSPISPSLSPNWERNTREERRKMEGGREEAILRWRCRERFRAALFTEVDLTILQESARERDLLGVAG